VGLSRRGGVLALFGRRKNETSALLNVGLKVQERFGGMKEVSATERGNGGNLLE